MLNSNSRHTVPIPKRFLLKYYDEEHLKRLVGDPIPDFVFLMPGTVLNRKLMKIYLVIGYVSYGGGHGEGAHTSHVEFYGAFKSESKAEDEKMRITLLHHYGEEVVVKELELHE